MTNAETYDTLLVPAIFEPWSRELIKRAQVWKGDKVLDVATGTGIVACRIAASGATVTGIDNNAEMLAQASVRAADEGVSVKWIEGSAETLPFRDPAFDLVMCQQGLQYVENKALAVREMRRVIKPGGRCVVATWTAPDKQGAFTALNELAATHGGSRGDAPYALADAAELTKLLEAAKFFAVTVESATRQIRVPEPERFVRFVLGNQGITVDDAICAEGLAAVAPFVADGQLVFPSTTLIGIGRVKT